MKSISIIGMGWLGLLLAKRLKLEGFDLLGTVSSSEKKAQLEMEFPQLEVFKLQEIEDDHFKTKDYFNADWVILTIPPSANESYVALMKQLILKIIEANAQVKILYTSSSSVYGEQNKAVDESSPTDPQSLNAQKILGVEDFIRENLEGNYAILRLAGLVGPNRHPVNYLIERKNVKGANKPVNLVHSDDILNVVSAIVKEEFPFGIYNICSPEHPLKKDFYTECANRIKKTAPEYNKFDNDGGKVLICSRLEALNYRFVYSSPYQFSISS